MAGGIGLISAILGIGGGAGIVLVGVLVDNLSYHWLFWVPLVAVVVAAIATALFVPESPVKAPSRINWLAAFLLATGLAAVLLAISEAPTWGWGSPRTLGLTAAGLLVLAAWVRVELRSREPLVDMRIMQLPAVWRTTLVAFLLGAGMYSSFILIPQLVELPKSTGFGFGASVTAAGLFMVPSTVTMLLAGSLAGPLEHRFGSKPLLAAGTIASAGSFALMAFAHSARIDIYLATTLLGLGIGLAFAALANLIVEAVPPDQSGVATGVNTIARGLGGALGSQVVASILAGAVTGAAALPSESGFTWSFALASQCSWWGPSLPWRFRAGGGPRNVPTSPRLKRLSVEDQSNFLRRGLKRLSIRPSEPVFGGSGMIRPDPFRGHGRAGRPARDGRGGGEGPHGPSPTRPTRRLHPPVTADGTPKS